MKSQYARQIRTCVTEWFKEHTATFFDVGGDATHPSCEAPKVHILHWSKPGTNIYRCNYVLHGNALMVHGDIGEAVYCWSQLLDFEFLASCNLDYFHGKCQASEVGRSFNQWDSRRMHEEIRCYLIEQQFNLESCSELLDVCKEAGSSSDWCRIVDERDLWKPLGSDWYEMASWGETINCRCIGHWVGIQMAMGKKDELLKKYSE